MSATHSLRLLAEAVSAPMIFKRQLPRAFGGARLFVSPGAGGLRYWRLNLLHVEPQLLAFIDEYVKPGNRVFDIGANVGIATVSAAYKAGRQGQVIAVEPDLRTAALLERTVKRLETGYAPVAVIPAAVHTPGVRFGRFSMASRAGASNALAGFGSTQMGGVAREISVICTTIDELSAYFGAPDVIKIDVERAEALALEGAGATLAAARPVLHIETSAATWDYISRLLGALRYRLFDAELPPGRRLPIDPGKGGPRNCLALPE